MVVGDLWQMVAASWQKAVVSATGRCRGSADNLRTLMSLAEREC